MGWHSHASFRVAMLNLRAQRVGNAGKESGVTHPTFTDVGQDEPFLRCPAGLVESSNDKYCTRQDCAPRRRSFVLPYVIAYT